MKKTFLFALALATLGSTGEARAAGKISGRIDLVDDHGEPVEDRSKVVVYLEAAPELARKTPVERTLEVRQKGKRFEPELLVAVRGESVSFPNDDLIFHNVFSLSDVSRFDLGLYKSGASKTVRFDHSGAIDVFCNIHPEMIAKIRVVDTPFFAVTGEDGTFVLHGVPPGKFMLVAWHVSGSSTKASVDVSNGTVAAAKLELVASSVRTRHRKKDGSSYGRYR